MGRGIGTMYGLTKKSPAAFDFGILPLRVNFVVISRIYSVDICDRESLFVSYRISSN
jgi:hypothetical protein